MDSARLTKSSQSFRRDVETHVSDGDTTGSQLTSTFRGFLYEEGYLASNGELPALPTDSDGESSESDLSNDPLMLLFEKMSAKPRVTANDSLSRSRDVAAEFQRMHQKFIRDIFEYLFHKKNNKTDCGKVLDNAEPRDAATEYQLVMETSTVACYTETIEYTSFSAQGIIQTDDGREININIDIAMSSRFCQYYSESITSAFLQAMDPLVVNLHVVPEGLSDLKYFFDLDADGTE